MAAPNLNFTYERSLISSVAGYNYTGVTFSANIEYQAFECRATKINEDFGVGKGELVASFSYTPANVDRVFEIYNSHLNAGDGQYRISLFAQDMDGSWNDNHGFIPFGETETMLTAEEEEFLCVR